MNARDPFLRHWLNILDRCLIWLVFSIVCTAVIWTAAWTRGLHQPVLNGWRVLYAVVTGDSIERTSLTLLALSAGAGVLLATVLSMWLFHIWKRQGEMRVSHLRGSRLEG